MPFHQCGCPAVGAMVYHWQKRRLAGKPQGGRWAASQALPSAGPVASSALSSPLYPLCLTGQNKEVKRGRGALQRGTGNFRGLAGKQ